MQGAGHSFNGPWRVMESAIFPEYELRLQTTFIVAGFESVSDAQLFADSHPEILADWRAAKQGGTGSAAFEDWQRWAYRAYGGHAPKLADSELDAGQLLIRNNMRQWSEGGEL